MKGITRYSHDVSANREAEDLKYFAPAEGENRDRFGNRRIASDVFSYVNREGQSIRATLLISPDGERFIKDNPRILTDIDRGLVQLQPGMEDKLTVDEFFELGRGRRISKYDSGLQSQVYLLEIAGRDKKFIIKTQLKQDLIDLTQPYVNEMLQVQALDADLSQQLEQLRIELPTFLFASGQVAGIKFEEGRHPVVNPDIFDRIKRMRSLLEGYIKSQKRAGNELWNRVEQDVWNHMGQPKTKNFMERPDGILVPVDLVYYAAPIEKS
jgi:hypothetical protein